MVVSGFHLAEAGGRQAYLHTLPMELCYSLRRPSNSILGFSLSFLKKERKVLWYASFIHGFCPAYTLKRKITLVRRLSGSRHIQYDIVLLVGNCSITKDLGC